MATLVSLGQVKDILSKNTPMLCFGSFRLLSLVFSNLYCLKKFVRGGCGVGGGCGGGGRVFFMVIKIS